VTSFSHEALLYAGESSFLAGTVPFIREGLAAEEPVMVAVSAARIDALRDTLADDADGVRFVDMAVLGSNPARIIPGWREFLTERPNGRAIRGIGEPIWAGRSAAELVECQRHESLLNLAFAGTPAFRLLCPYDTDALEPEVVHEALCSHPVVTDGPVLRESGDYRGLDAIAAPFGAPLPEPPSRPWRLPFHAQTLAPLRELVLRRAADAGLEPSRAQDLVLAVNEIAANSVRHGGGEGLVRMWVEDDALVCEIADGGHIGGPLVGRVRPVPGQSGGWGMWLVNQLCELVQVRTLGDGSVVRLHVRRAG
jgi:anti-sigma regulatory factor (Ser/Thr protein kinase)